LGTFAKLKSPWNVLALSCTLKELAVFAGCGTAVLLIAYAKVRAPDGFSPPPLHVLQPEQTASTVQCVALREAESVR
jgi:hypothetical protein